jgi:hypothetical protein
MNQITPSFEIKTTANPAGIGSATKAPENPIIVTPGKEDSFTGTQSNNLPVIAAGGILASTGQEISPQVTQYTQRLSAIRAISCSNNPSTVAEKPPASMDARRAQQLRINPDNKQETTYQISSLSGNRPGIQLTGFA